MGCAEGRDEVVGEGGMGMDRAKSNEVHDEGAGQDAPTPHECRALRASGPTGLAGGRRTQAQAAIPLQAHRPPCRKAEARKAAASPALSAVSAGHGLMRTRSSPPGAG